MSAEDIRALVDEIGFDYIARRSHRRPLRGQDARSWSPLIHSKAGGPELTHLP